jgi:hypothetical protein
MGWAYAEVTRKLLPTSRGSLSMHEGTWFSVAVAAYAKARQRGDQAQRERFAAHIVAEVKREEAIALEVWQRGDMRALLELSALVAHNLGDLDRVFEMWSIPDDDPLKARVHKASQEPRPGLDPILRGLYWINRELMAPENHRYFAFRQLRPVRRSADFMLPIPPFLDAWGERVASHPRLSMEDRTEVVLATLQGMKGLARTSGFARALAGMARGLPGGLDSLKRYLPARRFKELKSKEIQQRLVPGAQAFADGLCRRARQLASNERRALFPG